MDIGMEQPAFDELPFVYQVRIRDIEQELKDGEITQKGFSKRLAQIMQEYQQSSLSKASAAGKAMQIADIDYPMFSPDAHQVRFENIIDQDSSQGPVVGMRNGASKPNYDARKSTAMGFKKPGINFEALLDDFGAHHRDEDEDDEVIPPVPAMGQGSMRSAPSYGEELRDSGEFDEMTSGRAYNVLSDIMDPYGTRSSRNNQEFYSDDSSTNSIIGEITDLEPTGYGAEISPSHAPTASSGAATADDQSLGFLAGAEATRTNSFMNASDSMRATPSTQETEVTRTNSLAHLGERDKAAPSYNEPIGNPRPEPIRVAPQPRDITDVLHANGSLLTPDTPTVGMFIHGGIAPPDTVTMAMLGSKRSHAPHAPLNAVVENAPASIMSPVSGTGESYGFDPVTEPVNYPAQRTMSLQQQRQSRPQTAESAGSENGATNTSGGGTITLEDMASEGSRQQLQKQLQQQHQERNNINSAAFGGGLRVTNGAVVDIDAKEPETLADIVGQMALQDAMPPPAGRASRRPTIGTRMGRRQTNTGGPFGSGGRLSYYPAEAETELEIPATFDVMDAADIIGADDHPDEDAVKMHASKQSIQYTFEEAAAMNMDAQTYLEAEIAVAPAAGRTSRSIDAPGGGDFGGRVQSAYMMETPLVYEHWDASMQDGGPPVQTYAPQFKHDEEAAAAAAAAAADTPVVAVDSFPATVTAAPAPTVEPDALGDYTAANPADVPFAENSVGAIVYSSEIPDEAYSSKLRHVMSSFSNLAAVLRHRAQVSPDGAAYACVDAKGRETGTWTWSGVHMRARQIVALLRQKGVTAWGARVALVYRKYEVLEFIGSLFGCFYAGVCAVPVVAGDSYAELAHVLNSTGAALVLTTELNVRALNKDLAQSSVGPGWPANVEWVRTDHLLSSSAVLGDERIDDLSANDLAFIEFSKSPNGELKGVEVTHAAVMRQSSVWMLSTGLLAGGRRQGLRVQLAEDCGPVDPDGLDYSHTLGENPGDAADAAVSGSADLRSRRESADTLQSTDLPTPSKHRWGGGILGRLRNAGSLPKMRRGSTSHTDKTASAGSAYAAQQQSRQSGASSTNATGRMRAASNLSSTTGGMLHSPTAMSADRDQSTLSPDVLVFYVEPRQHIGLALGILGGCYGGHQSVYASSAICDTAGALIHVLTRYAATVALGDYAGLQTVLSTATDEPESIRAFNRKTTPNLGALRLLLIDTLFIDLSFHAAFNRSVLHPFGCAYRSVADTEGHDVLTPVCTLAEHGSRMLALRPANNKLGASFASFGTDDRSSELVLDREALRQNRIVLVEDKGEAHLPGTARMQTFGPPAAGATVAVVDPETRELCASDAVGELWMAAPDGDSSGAFWGLPKLSASIFTARFTYAGGARASSGEYLRTGLMGAVVRGQVLVLGFYEDRIRTLTTSASPAMEPELAFHYAADINATVRRLLPQIGACAAFEMYANDTHLAVVAAEVRHSCGSHALLADEIYTVLRTHHGLSSYAVALCPPNALPRAFQYGKRAVNAQLCRHQFESGRVPTSYVRLSTEGLFLNLPPPAQASYDPADDALPRWTQVTSLEPPQPPVDPLSGADLGHFGSITELLIWRATTSTPNATAFSQFDERGRALKPLSYARLAERVASLAASMLEKRRVRAGDHVVVALSPSIDFVAAIHACMAIGAVPIAIAPPDAERLADDLPPLLAAVREYGVAHVLVDAQGEAVLTGRQMEAALRVPAMRGLLAGRRMPQPLNVLKARPCKVPLGGGALRFDSQWSQPGRAALVMLFSGSQPSTPRFVSYTHASILRFCAQQMADFQMMPNLPLIASVRAYSGYGLLHCVLMGIFVGCPTLLLPAATFFSAPHLWFDLVQRHGVKDAFATLPMLQHAMRYLSSVPHHAPTFSLACVRNLIVATDERVDPAIYAGLRDFFAPYGLDPMAINPLYGTQMNACISTRAYLGVTPLTLRLDPHALRRARVFAVPPEHAAEDDPHLLTLQDSGKVSGSTMVAIVDPATHTALPSGSVGEIWVCSESNALQRQTPLPGAALSAGARPLLEADECKGVLSGGPDCEFVRTGDLGFLYLPPADSAGAPAEPYLFVAGKMDATFNVDGYMYFYTDIERAVEEPSEDISSGSCVVIQTTAPNVSDGVLRLVAVVGVRQVPDPAESFLPNIACLMFNSVLERHQVVLDEFVFVPWDTLPRSRIAERRRRTVRGLYESGKIGAYASFPVANSATLPSGVANPNNRQSFLGPASLAFGNM
ncbi:hypothetical protein GGI07_001616 [Coemansia sp. Benny D115]|nr:hypothetical protein GGI07_001616 [Coemansia sp. Benny D115]